ncbi:glycosyltransferase family 2 protein [Pseudoalteromonas sp. APC 3694]|uniref:glycosyltransferase family 2 protein n=1 Tax=Pseudoalteromonas sp. APC 3694 TaxID=3035202 RepID=UPI0025B31FC1|nr:glycosyltransferase family 2 protein [Pseudoalteromonas sp. APC 3694]MDN3489401.1 glycosyltransferase family 2 protein [Pseudoalteromonas sp. APC 3694]
MSLSIVIPIYNVEKYLEECVNSVLKLSGIDHELILIDDGSTDNSLKIINENYSKYEHVKIYSQKNSGLSSARNMGTKLATKKYIMYLDSDDVINNDNLNKNLKLALSKDLDILLFSGQPFIGDTDSTTNYHVNYSRPEALNHKVLTGVDILNIMLRENYFCSACMYFFKKEKYMNIFFEQTTYEDNLFTSQLLNFPQTNTVQSTTDVIYYRRIRSESIMTSQVKVGNFKAYEYVINKLINSKSLSDDRRTKQNISYIIGNIHAQLVSITFNLEEWGYIKKIIVWLTLYKYFFYGKYRLKSLIKSIFPIKKLIKRI